MKTIKRLLLLIALFWGGQAVNAQTFNNLYGLPTSLPYGYSDHMYRVSTMEIYQDGDASPGFIKVGSLAVTPNPSFPNDIEHYINVTKVKLDGTIEWSKNYMKEGHALVHGSVAQSHTDDAAVIVGTIQDVSGNSAPDMLAFKIDYSGNIVWDRVYSTDYGDEGLIVEQVPGGEMMLVGTASDNGGNRDVYCVLISDATGVASYQKRYAIAGISVPGRPQTMSYDPVLDIVKIMGTYDQSSFYTLGIDVPTGSPTTPFRYTINGHTIELAGFIKTTSAGYIMSFYQSSGSSGPHCTVMEISSSDGIQWCYEYPQLSFGLAVYEHPTSSGYRVATNLPDQEEGNHPGLLDIDNSGIVQHFQYYGKPTDVFVDVSSMILTTDDGVLINTNNPGYLFTGFQLVKTDVGGASDCDNSIQVSENQLFPTNDQKTVTDDDDGTDLAANLSSANQPLNRFGCDGSEIQQYSKNADLPTNEGKAAEQPVSAFPNPTTGGFVVQGMRDGITHLRIIDVRGREIFVGQKTVANGRLDLDLEKLTNGTYLLILEQEGEVFTTQLVKE